MIRRCRVVGCSDWAGVPGSAKGYCIRHYARFRKNGLCEAMGGCESPAVSHMGLCDRHVPRGIPR